MEKELILEFLGNSSGYGFGYGDSDGDGYGYGSGSGYGYGDGSGDGYGYGDGYGLKCINGEEIYSIDNIPTVIRQIHGDIAKGAMLNNDLTFTECYVVRRDGKFAHGETLRDAMDALTEKLFMGMSEDERIQSFIDAHEHGKTYPNKDFFAWHHRLTGSCEAGRKKFIRDHGIDMDASMTVDEFIALTRDDYGRDTIRRLEEQWHEA